MSKTSGTRPTPRSRAAGDDNRDRVAALLAKAKTPMEIAYALGVTEAYVYRLKKQLTEQDQKRKTA